MNPTWIPTNNGGLVRAATIRLVYRTDLHATEGEIPCLLIYKDLHFHPLATTLAEAVRQVEAAGVPLLRCQRAHSYGMPDHWHEVWVNLAHVLHAAPSEKQVRVYLEGMHNHPLGIVDPPPADFLAALRGNTSNPTRT